MASGIPYHLEDGVTHDSARLQLRTFIQCDERLAMTIYPGSPDNDADVAKLQERLEKSDTKDQAAGAKVLYKRAIATGSGETLGVARWVFWPKGGAGDSKQYAPSTVDWVPASQPADLEYTQWAFDEYYRLRGRLVQGPHAMLELLYVSSTARRLGLGRHLVQLGTQQADEMGIPCFVEASVMGRPLYEKCGFGLVEDVDLKAPQRLHDAALGRTGLQTTVMRRPPVTAGSTG